MKLLNLLLLQASSAFITNNFGGNQAAKGQSFKIKKTAFFSQTEKGEEVTNTNVVIEALDKRLNDGPLSGAETGAVFMASGALLDYLDEEEVVVSDHKEDVSIDVMDENPYDAAQLRVAATQLDVDAVSNMFDAGLKMDEETTEAAFWAVVNEVDRSEEENLPLSANVTNMLHFIFDADLENLKQREKITKNVTCMQPDDSGGMAGAARKMNYVFDDGDHKNLPLTEGRRCEGGTCCDACSRNIFPTFASEAEINLDTFPDLSALTFNELEKVSAATIIQFVRLVERVRRTMAYEYGLELHRTLCWRGSSAQCEAKQPASCHERNLLYS